MSEGLNKVILMGNLGADPDLKYTGSGTPVLHLRMATNESFVDRNKEIQERTEWHSIVFWGNRAEALAKILSKGDGVLVEGGLHTSSYEKEGTKRYRTEVVARDLRFTGRRLTPLVLGDEDTLTAPPEATPQAPATARGMKTGGRSRAPEMPSLDDLPY